jgi:hypothetical protein
VAVPAGRTRQQQHAHHDPRANAYWRSLTWSAEAPTRSGGAGMAWRIDQPIGAELSGRVRELCQSLSIPLKAFYLAAYFGALEQRYGAGRPTVGVVMNGRAETLSDPFKALGLFWNILPVCEQERGDSLSARALHAHALLLQAEHFGAYPLPRLLECLEPHERPAIHASFNFIHFHHAQRAGVDDGGLAVTRGGGHDKFHYPINLAVAIDPHDGAASLVIEFDPAWFD